MGVFKFVIGDNKKSYQVEKDQKDCPVLGKKIGDVLLGDFLGLSNYELQITGGSDKDGFPMRKDIDGVVRKKFIVVEGTGLNTNISGLRRRKTLRGNAISSDIVQINCKIVRKGPASLEEILGKREEVKEEIKKVEEKVKKKEESKPEKEEKTKEPEKELKEHDAAVEKPEKEPKETKEHDAAVEEVEKEPKKEEVPSTPEKKEEQKPETKKDETESNKTIKEEKLEEKTTVAEKDKTETKASEKEKDKPVATLKDSALPDTKEERKWGD